jgi:hypothetical protein
MAENISLVFYQELKYKWSREEYSEFCSSNKISGLVWKKAEVWKLRGIKRGSEEGTFPLCVGNKHVKHILFSCPDTKEWRTQFINKKWNV